ncbi:MAG: DinB family protein [Caldilineaceae bacterium]|nr:DinB family protein [Caldilineaceae bacterium]
MQRHDIVELLHYNTWATARSLAKIEQLSDEQLKAPANLDHGTAWQTLLHLVDVEWSWRLMAQRIPATQLVWEVADLADLPRLQTFWQAEQARLLAYVEQVPEENLSALVEYGSPQGRSPQSAKLWHILAHIVNHSTQHRTELARYLTDCGFSPGDLSLLAALSIESTS